MTAPIPLDYTSRDYDSILADLVAHAKVVLPEWSYTGPADFGVLLMELWAHVGDVMHFYVDRAMFESFVQTAAMRSSMLNLASMFGYRPNQRSAAACTVQFTIVSSASATVIPALTPVLTSTAGSGDQPIRFETQSMLTIAAGQTTGTVSAIEGKSVRQEVLGETNGAVFQDFSLYYPNVIGASPLIEVAETDDTWTLWSEVQRFGDAGRLDTVYTTYMDENGITHIVFGDNIYGRIPTVGSDVRASYRIGVGSEGNIPVNSIATLGTTVVGVISVTNTTAATGGVDDESIDSLRRTVPSSMRTIERAVSLMDYYSLGLQVPGVAKASVIMANHTQATVYVAPAGGGAPAALLLDTAATWLQARSMVGTTVQVFGPTYVSVNITVSLYVQAQYLQSKVKTAVTLALQNLLSFANTDFGSGVTIGAVYRAIYNVEGVDHATLTTLSTTTGVADIAMLTYQIAQAGTISITPISGGIIG